MSDDFRGANLSNANLIASAMQDRAIVILQY